MDLEKVRWISYGILFLIFCVNSYRDIKKRYEKSKDKRKFKVKSLLITLGFLSPIIAAIIRWFFFMRN